MKDIRPAPYFTASSVALDFVNTLSVVNGRETEWLNDGDDLLSWLSAARLAPDSVLEKFRSDDARNQRDQVAAEARDLREWLRKLVLENCGAPFHPVDAQTFAPVNAVLARDDSYTEIEITEREGFGASATKSARQRWRQPDALLLPVAKAIATFICDDDFTYIKTCEGRGCKLLFLDRTASRRRRWCDMSLCGNRAKQSQKRARQTNSATPS